MKEIGIYIHIPFCIKKCLYCDFCSYSNMEQRIPEYVNALVKEIRSWEERLKEYRVKSIFIGGGTPSLLSNNEMDKILSTIYSRFELSPNIEFSIESNPGTLEKEKITYYLRNGINRLSMGLQAWQNELLKALGRIHNQEVFLSNFTLAREMGFNNINIDLMFGLPNQTQRQWEETLYQVIKLKPEHISAYSLKIEDNTEFGRMYNRGKIHLPSDEDDRRMYHFAIDFLINHGYKHYEISNFSKKDKECIHNMLYWNNEEYVGFGLGAHSYLGKIRFSNATELEKYLNMIHHDECTCIFEEKNSIKDEIAETMFLGLRMMEGIDIEKFKKRFGCTPFSVYSHEILKLQDDGLLKIEDHSIKLTRKGIDLSNQVFIAFLPD